MRYEMLSNLTKIRTGFPFRGKIVHDPKGDIRVLQIKDLRLDPPLNAGNSTLVNRPPNLDDRVLQMGDILIPARGEFRKAVMFNESVPAVASSQLHNLRISSKELLPMYLCWALNQPKLQHAMATDSQGSNVTLLNRRSLGAMPVAVPPLPIQKQIVKILEVSAKEEELSKRVHTNRKAMFKGMVQKLMNQETTEETLLNGETR